MAKLIDILNKKFEKQPFTHFGVMTWCVDGQELKQWKKEWTKLLANNIIEKVEQEPVKKGYLRLSEKYKLKEIITV